MNAKERVFKETKLRNLNVWYDKLKNSGVTMTSDVEKEISSLEKELGMN